MQYTTTLSVALFAAVATAYQHLPHAPQHFQHRRQLNGTIGAQSTTLTVFATQIHTITSCAPTVTDCPARNQVSAGAVVTEIITLATTVCPVAQASSVQSSIISSAIASGSGAIIAPTPTSTPSPAYVISSASIVPFVTGTSGGSTVVVPGGGVPAGSISVAQSVATSEATLTYTIGAGSSTTVITTVIKHISTATVYAVKPSSVDSGLTAAGNPAAASSTGLTTTILGTSTSTKYVTVVAVSSTNAGGNPPPAAATLVGGNPPPAAATSVGGNTGITGVTGGNAEAEAGSCGATVTLSAAPVTVTVEAQAVTVTAAPVTVTVAATTVTITASANCAAGGVIAAADSGAAASDNAVVSTATVVPVPIVTGAPFGNGTAATSTKGPCSSVFPSGFISMAKPSGTEAPIFRRQY